jgi:hypothetical protein
MQEINTKNHKDTLTKRLEKENLKMQLKEEKKIKNIFKTLDA